MRWQAKWGEKMISGTLFGIGVGPGDPELMTLKAARILAAAPVVAYFAKRGNRGTARAIADGYLARDVIEIPLYYPFTVEIAADGVEYGSHITQFYDESAHVLASHLDAGRNVAVLCAGDPLFYGSYIYLHDRLAQRFVSIVVPGVTSIAGCASVARLPLSSTNEVFSVIPGTLPEEMLERRLADADAAAIIKIGRNFAKVRRVLDRLGRLGDATYVERGTMARQVLTPLSGKHDNSDEAVYFSLILLPGHRPEKWRQGTTQESKVAE